MNHKEIKIEAGQRKFDERVEKLREQLANISDENLLLFADYCYNNYLQSAVCYIEAMANDERINDIELKEKGCDSDF
jgi:hypothetical protein